MADLVISIDLDASGVQRGSQKVRSSVAGLSSDIVKRLKAIGPQIQQIGQSIMSAGQSLSIGITAPLTALATLGIKAALELDKVRTKITALVGDSVKANQKIAELRKLADESVGVTRASAMETFAQLKGIGGIADEAINRVIKALGKLNAAFNLEDQAGFVRNLTQIFSQGFEIADIKEAIGRVPIFNQLLEQAFGTSDPAKLKALKEAGKLTIDTWMSGIAEAVDKDSRTGRISENLTTKLAKGFEKMNDALAPLGDILLQGVVPILEQLEPYVIRFSEWFSTLSQPIKIAIVAVLGFVAALGPLLIVLGAVVAAIGSLIAAAPTIAIVVAAIIGLGLQLAPIIVWVVALAAAWYTNWGGIRDFTDQVGAEIIEIWEQVKVEVIALTDQLTAEVTKFWEENGEDIKAAVKQVEEYVRSVWQDLLAWWKENGEGIKSTAKSAWDAVKAIVLGAVRIVMQAIKLVAAVINGDWSKAWDATKEIVKIAIGAWTTILMGAGSALVTAFKEAFQALWALETWMFEQALKLGKFLVRGLISGIIGGNVAVFEAGKNLVMSAIGGVSAGGEIQSPSRATMRLGAYLGEGLAIGIALKANQVKAAAKQLATDAIKELADVTAQFVALATASPETIGRMQQRDTIQQLIDDMREILRLRRELGADAGQALPADAAGVAAELKTLQDSAKGREDFTKMMDDIGASVERTSEAIKQANEAFEERKRAMEAAGEIELINLQEEIRLIGVVDEIERQRIINYHEIQRLRSQMMSDGYAESQIAEAVAIAKIEQNKRLELQQIREFKLQEVQATREAVEEQKRLYDQLGSTIREGLNAAQGGFGSFFGWVKNKFQTFLQDLIAEWLTSKFFDMFFKGGNSRAAQSSGSGGGGILGAIQNAIFGGGRSGNAFAGGSSSVGSGNPLDGINIGSGGFDPRTGTYSNASSGSGMGLAGGLSLAGAGANIVGGLIGGRVGGFISNIGTGVAMGAQIGSIIPGVGTAIGAVVGGAVGFLASLFGGDPKRKRDKNEKLPALSKGFVDAITQIKQLIDDTRTLRIDPTSALAKATELRASIASGFDIQFESKKYKKQAQTMIGSKLREADSLIEELRRVAEISRAAGERERRLLPEFAGGVFISPGFQAFRRRNGMLAGAWTGRDTIPAMVAAGEMILNPYQQARVRANAGGDVFKGAGIPGYASGGMVQAEAAQPVVVSQGDVHVTVHVQQDEQGRWTAMAKSTNGQKVITSVVAESYRNDSLKLQRRGG